MRAGAGRMKEEEIPLKDVDDDRQVIQEQAARIEDDGTSWTYEGE